MPSSPLLLPFPAYTPVVGALVANMEDTRATTLAAVQGLSAADLAHRHDERANSIGALLAHMASMEWYFLANTLETDAQHDDEWQEFGAAGLLGDAAEKSVAGRDLAWHTERLARVRERSLAGLRTVDDEWLQGSFVLPWNQKPATRYWAWFHVSEDELNHRGQIRWLRTRLPGQS